MWMLLCISVAYAATIPPSVPSSSPCLQKCFEDSTILQAANDLNNFKNIAVNIDMFCQVNSDVLKCGRECPDIPELEARTAYSSFICAEKGEQFRLIKDCMENSKQSVDLCMQDCGLPAAALRFDNSPGALVNPTAFFDGIGESCDKHICALKCSMKTYEQACPGSGDLLKDYARFQVNMGIDRLNQTSQKENETTQQVVLNYLKNLPAKCAFMQDPELFDIAIASAKTPLGSSQEKSEETSTDESVEAVETNITGLPQTQFSGDASVTTALSEGETTMEFEPSNEPEVPIGAPESGVTAEPSKEVEGQPETDETIIDHEGRPNPTFVKSSTDMPTASEEGTTEQVVVPDNDVEPVSTATTEEREPVIVVDDTEKRNDTNDLNAVKSGSTFAALAIFAITAVIAG